MNKRTLIAAAVAASTLMPFGAAQALTAGPASFNVTATIANFCTISAANVAFGSVNAGVAATNSASSVSLTCNKGAAVTAIALNNGTNPTGTQKRMKDPVSGDFLSYSIDAPTGAALQTCPAAGTSEWTAANTIVATPLFTTTGGLKLITLCASIPAGQFPTAGTGYTDTVQVTATYN